MPEYSQMMGSTLSKGLTGLSKKQLGGGSGMSGARETAEIIARLSKAEAPYKDELEELAVVLCKEMFPIIEDQGYQINAKIVSISDVNASLQEVDQDMSPFDPKQKRRVTNAITQGASVRATENFQFNDMYNDYIAAIDPKLREEYVKITKKIFQVYHDPITVPMMLQTAYAGQAAGAGSSKVRLVDKGLSENAPGGKVYAIDALGVCFPVLVHEIVKGLYEILSRHSLSGDTKEANQAIVDAVDTLQNEVDDIQYGRFIHEAILMPYEESAYKDDARLREFLLVNIYKLSDVEFSNYIRTSLAAYVVGIYNSASDKDKEHLAEAYNDLIQPTVKAKWQADWKKWTGWAEGTMAQGDRYYKRKDTGLKGLK